MTISSAVNRVDYVGTGAVSAYDFTFKVFSSSDLLVTQRDTSNVETTLVLNTDYTVALNSDGTGTITLTAGSLTTGYALTIRRVRQLTQTTDIRNQGTFYPESHENAFDHLVMLSQQQQDELDRSTKLPESISSSAFDPTLPSTITANGGRAIKINDAGNGFDVGPSATEVAQAIAQVGASPPYYNALEYGDGNYTDDTMGSCLTDVGSGNWVMMLKKGTWIIDANTTIPDRVLVWPEHGCVLQVATGVNLTISFHPLAPISQILDLQGSATVTFGISTRVVYPEWFGAAGDASTDDRAAIQKCIDNVESYKTIKFTRRYAFTTTSITVDHSDNGGGASESYTAVWSFIDKDHIFLDCTEGQFIETFTPGASDIYQLFVSRDSQHIKWDLNFLGSQTLTNAMNNSTNPLDANGCEVVMLTDFTVWHEFNINCKNARAPIVAQGYDASANQFTSGYEPRHIKAVIFSEDTKYGCRYTGAFNTDTKLTAINNKRSYRLEGGSAHIFDVNIGNDFNYSWDDGNADFYINAGNLWAIQGVQGRLNMLNRNTALSLRCLGNGARIQDVHIHVNMVGGSNSIELANANNSASADCQWENIKITGFQRSSNVYPIRMKPFLHASDTGSAITNLTFENFTSLNTAAKVYNYVYTEGTLTRTDAFVDLKFINVKFKGTGGTSDGNSDGYKDGSIVLTGITNLLMRDVKVDSSGMTTASEIMLRYQYCVQPIFENVKLNGPTISSANITYTGGDDTVYNWSHGDDNRVGAFRAKTTSGTIITISPDSGPSSKGEVVIGDGFLRFQGQQSTPSAPNTDQAYMYTVDAGSSKCSIRALFDSGAEQTIASEP